MSWVNDLASATGVPVGAATLAAAFFAACSEAESNARPEALKTITALLKEPSRSGTGKVIQRAFEWTFGAHHLSWKCMRQSMLATIVFNLVLNIILYSRYDVPMTLLETRVIPLVRDVSNLFPTIIGLIVAAILFCVVPDYISLWKTRLTLRVCRNTSGLLPTFGILVLDICLSIVISVVLLIVFKVMLSYSLHVFTGEWPVISVEEDKSILDVMHMGFLYGMFDTLKIHGLISDYGIHATIYGIFLIGGQFINNAYKADPTFTAAFLSTLMTSTWLLLAFASTLTIKIIAPIQRFTASFFDIDTHPLRAIGTVSACITMAVALAWSALRAVI